MAAIPALQLRVIETQADPLDASVLRSPSGALVFRYRTTGDFGEPAGEGGQLIYSVCSRTGPVILDSRLSLAKERRGASLVWWNDLRVSSVSRSSSRSEWTNAIGERAVIPDHYNELRIGLAWPNASYSHAGGDVATLQVRAYDEAIAFRLTLLDTLPQALRDDIGTETIEFNLPNGTYAYWNTYAQGAYERRTLVDLEKPCEPPLTLELADGQWASILEAAQVDFAHMTIAGQASGGAPNRLVSQLDGDIRIPRVPYDLPWRVIMVADSPGRLLEHNYVSLNLNPPSRIEDTSWIQPGRVMRAISLATDAVIRVVDFATDFNIDYVELDAGWYGSEYDPRNDATKWNATLIDLPKVLSYAKSKGRKIIMYVNHIELERHLEEVLDKYQEWGVDGVKYGFVHVGPQNWTQWLHGAVVEAAKRGLVVDIHDNYRSTGFHRTYPNLLQVEGINGDEGFPTADQSTIYPFTRFLTGPADHTYCFRDARLKKTKAHQLALPIINFGPLQFLFWYDWPGPDFVSRVAEAEIWRDLPTVWDDTRVLLGVPGRIVAVARRRGSDWWVGIVGNETAQECELEFGFLDKGATYNAIIYEDDGPEVDSTVVSRPLVLDRSSKPSIALRPSGGAAMRLRRIVA